MDLSYNQPPRRQALAAVALMLGIASIFFFQTIILPLILGGCAITLAILSKGYAKKMAVMARIAVGCACGGICIACTVVISVLYLFISRPQILINYGSQYDRMYEQMYGAPTEEVMGISYEDMLTQYVDLFQSIWKGASYDNR